MLGINYLHKFSQHSSSQKIVSGNELITNSSPKLIPLSEMLAKADLPQLTTLSKAFKGNILCSENFIGHTKGVITTLACCPFGKKQKPILEVLIVQEGEGYTVCLLDQEDAAFWRRKIEENRMEERELRDGKKVALFDIGLNRIVATGKNRLTKERYRRIVPIQAAI